MSGGQQFVVEQRRASRLLCSDGPADCCASLAAVLGRRTMPRLHLDHRVKQSRITANVLSCNRDAGFEFTSLRVSSWLDDSCSIFRLVWRQCTQNCMRPEAIMPYGVCIQPFLDPTQVRRNERYPPPAFQTPEEPLHLGVELPHARRTPSVLDTTLNHRRMK